MHRVFLVFCELAGESPPLRAQGRAGAFVTCFVRTNTLQEANQIASDTLEGDGYRVTDIDKAIAFDQEDWEHEQEYTDLADETLHDGEMRYSEFFVWRR